MILHVDDAGDPPADLRDERDVADLAQMASERLAMGGIVGGPLGDPPAELDEQSRDRRPVAGRGEPDVHVGAHQVRPIIRRRRGTRGRAR